MTRARVWGSVIALALFGIIALMFSLNHVEPGEAGLAWNPTTGSLTAQSQPGWYVTSPLTMVASIDTRPQRLCLTSSAHAGVNCRLVQFDIAKYREFIAVEGWSYYWWANRFSFNSGYDETYRGFRDVLRGYAFSAQQYPFVVLLEE